MLNDPERQSTRADRLASLRIERREESTPRRRPWLWAGVGLALLLAVLAWRWVAAAPRVGVRLASAQEVVLDGAGATVLNASGYVTARRQATVSSKVTGRVVEVLIEEGMSVAEGQVMARVDASNLDVALRLAQAQVRAAQTALDETRVRAREALLELERTRRLLAAGVASQAEVDRGAAEHDALVARLERQQDEVAVAQRETEVWGRQIADAEIRAPFAGVVVAKNAQPGEMISPAAAGGGFTRTGIGTVVDMESLEIEVDVNESYINRVSPGQPVEATLDAYGDWQIPARVIAIVPTADRQRATVKVRIGFDALDPRILPDMGVKVAFRESDAAESTRRARVVVPTAALRRLDGRDVVFVVVQDVAQKRVVATGGEHEGGTIVLSGVSAGERVIVDGPAELAGGEEVEEVSL